MVLVLLEPRRYAVRGFKNGMTGQVVMLAPGAIPMPPTCAARGVADIVAVQVQRGDHGISCGASSACCRKLSAMASLMITYRRWNWLHLFIGNGPRRFLFWYVPIAARYIRLRQIHVRPAHNPSFKSAFHVFHDIAPVHDCNWGQFVFQRMFDGGGSASRNLRGWQP